MNGHEGSRLGAEAAGAERYRAEACSLCCPNLIHREVAFGTYHYECVGVLKKHVAKERLFAQGRIGCYVSHVVAMSYKTLGWQTGTTDKALERFHLINDRFPRLVALLHGSYSNTFKALCLHDATFSKLRVEQ